jgi:hypothetical protein
MPDNVGEIAASVNELARLAAQGVLGFYTHFEVTEVFGYLRDQPPVNVFSILVAEERLTEGAEPPTYLGDRIQLQSLKDWTFGVQQSLLPVGDLPNVFKTYCDSGKWKPSGEPLQVGILIPVPTQFVPPDSTLLVPLNNVLKNNFWSGAYLIEFADPDKSQLQPFFDEPPRLQELSEAIQKFVPIRIASLSDRLGNVIVQLPLTAILVRFAKNRITGDSIITVHWHPRATPRPLRATCEMQFDNMISSYASANVQEGGNSLPTAAGDGMQRGVIWDDLNSVILAATGLTGFFETIACDMHVLQPEPRVFIRQSAAGTPAQVRIGLQRLMQNRVGTPRSDQDGGWTRKRIYRYEAAQSAVERVFVQYMPASGRQEAEHEKALQDVRHLIRRYGKKGAWLWDPFLSAEDILDTLFHCPYIGTDLRALTDAQEIPASSSVGQTKPRYAILHDCLRDLFGLPQETPPKRPSFADRQRATIAAAQSNLLGLRLEYRARVGQAGWGFHDRFLIFPYVENGALAWSLGTSINGLGKQHHILQRVDDGRIIADAFEKLWTQLDQHEHLIWKVP